MSKPNKDGWIRHRGGKCQVEAGGRVDYRMRNGRIGINERAELLDWGRDKEIPRADIMAYRLHNPAEQVEACSKPDPHDSAKRDSDYVCWMRDRIAEIDRTVEALEEERVSLVQRLEGEGFRLIERVNAGLSDAMQAHEDMSNPKNWRVGDVFAQIAEGSWSHSDGTLWTMTHDGGTDMRNYRADTGSDKYVKDFALKFHSRPSK